jgi:acyl-CoA hydrolase
MEGKRIRESIATISHVVSPQDANPMGNAHGGVIMKLIDETAGVVASRHSRCTVVTASIDRLDFYTPAFIGDIITLKGSINLVGRTSMEIGVSVDREDLKTGKVYHVALAYLTMVAMDEERRPKEVPPLVLENADEKRFNREAISRRELRLAEKKREIQS